MAIRITKHLITFLLVPVLGLAQAGAAPGPKEIDGQEMIRNSYQFLLNREPEMTDTEFAIYEQVLPMVFDKPEVAILILETMLADDEPESPAFSYVLANVYYSSEHYDLAEKHYKSAIEDYPDFLRAWVNLGILYYTVDKFQEAIPCFSKAVTLGTQAPQVLGLLGYCLKETNNPLAAEAALQQAFTADPLNSDWIEALLDLYLTSKQYDRAELLVRELVKLKPETKSYWKAYSSLLLSTERKVEAITVLEVQLNLGLADPEDILLLGDLYAEQSLFREAMATYESAIQLKPIDVAKHLLRYARSLVYLGSYEKAELLLARLDGQVSPEQLIELLLIRAEVYQAREDMDGALEVFNEVLQRDPLNGEALLGVGRIYSRQNNREKARFLFEQAVKIPEFTFQASIELANIALMERHYQEGINYLRDALRIEYRPEIESHILRLESMNAALP